MEAQVRDYVESSMRMTTRFEKMCLSVLVLERGWKSRRGMAAGGSKGYEKMKKSLK